MKPWLLLILAFCGAAGAEAGDWTRLWPVEVHGKWGYIDEHGKLAVKPQFDSAGSFGEPPFARVRLGDKWGGMAAESLRVPLEYDYIGAGNPLPLRKGTTWSLRSYYYGADRRPHDTLIVLDCDSLGNEFAGRFPVFKHGQQGFIDFAGVLVIPAVYDADAPAICLPDVQSTSYHTLAVRRGGKWGLISDTDSVLVPFAYDSFAVGRMAQLVAARVEGRWGYIDRTGTVRIPMQYDAARGFDFGFDHPADNHWGFGVPSAAVSRNGLWGFIDSTGREIVPLKYQQVGAVGKTLTPVCSEGKWGYIDLTGAMAIPARYDSAGSFGPWACVKTGRKYGFIDDQGHSMIAPQFDAVSVLANSGFPYLVRKNGRCGFVRPQGNPPVIGWYDAVALTYFGWAYVQDHGRWKYIGTDGKTVWPATE